MPGTAFPSRVTPEGELLLHTTNRCDHRNCNQHINYMTATLIACVIGAIVWSSVTTMICTYDPKQAA